VSAGEPLTVAVLAGGRSSEHDVSLASGGGVRDGLLAGGHRVIFIEIAADGSWRRDGAPLSLVPAAGLLDADVAFPALHGPFGEDGTIQGVLEMLDVPYVGAGVAASAVCLDKVLFKDLMSAIAMPQVAYVGVRRERFERDRAAVLAEASALGLPLFVKPAHLGSSIGIVRVASVAALAPALEAAFAHDPRVIVEAGAAGIEVECGVVGVPAGESDPAQEDAFASELGEVTFAGELYDYGAKYTPGGMELVIPARVSDHVRDRIRELALRAFHASGCEGLARVDFFVDGEEVLLNELNTMPGFTPTSVYAKLLGASGVPYPRLLERLCRLALERHEQRRSYSF
jgi:D-alanine-D-alanine ligase